MTPTGIEPATFRFLAQHLNHCDTAVPLSMHLGAHNKRHSDQITSHRHVTDGWDMRNIRRDLVIEAEEQTLRELIGRTGENIKIKAGVEDVHSGVWWEHLGVIHYLGNLSLDGRILLKRFFKDGIKDVD